ncbi:hypothetical protein CRG98_001051 [Punica granatum]|uniref:Uncharacterized protein n=1 Tax=Punica granatum TaxID=22663 RepID=A0A2I0LCZ4_PUNGR|nr:hypothetical protein CRG98_001051 [Punica granatum]
MPVLKKKLRADSRTRLFGSVVGMEEKNGSSMTVPVNLAGAVDVESAHWMRKGRRSASTGMSCRPPSYLITRPGNMSVLPKWLRRGTPTISGHPVIMGPPGFHRATHRNREGVSSRQKCLHSENLCSGGRITGTRRSIKERSSAM